MPGQWRYIKAPKKDHRDGIGAWSDKKKNEAIAIYIATGSPSLTAQQANIPLDTIEGWQRQDWWRTRITEIQNTDYDKLDSKLSKTIDAALDQLMDRIKDGEYMFDVRTGKVKRIPAKLRDINSALTSVIDKRQLIRKLPTKIVEQQTTATQLKNLAEQFTKFVTGQSQKETFNTLVHEVIEGETVEQDVDGTYIIKE